MYIKASTVSCICKERKRKTEETSEEPEQANNQMSCDNDNDILHPSLCLPSPSQMWTEKLHIFLRMPHHGKYTCFRFINPDVILP